LLKVRMAERRRSARNAVAKPKMEEDVVEVERKGRARPLSSSAAKKGKGGTSAKSSRKKGSSGSSKKKKDDGEDEFYVERHTSPKEDRSEDEDEAPEGSSDSDSVPQPAPRRGTRAKRSTLARIEAAEEAAAPPTTTTTRVRCSRPIAPPQMN
jgi:hypothetical protein